MTHHVDDTCDRLQSASDRQLIPCPNELHLRNRVLPTLGHQGLNQRLGESHRTVEGVVETQVDESDPGRLHDVASSQLRDTLDLRSDCLWDKDLS